MLPEKGTTLIELLVVLLLIGIITSFSLLSLPVSEGKKPLHLQGKQLLLQLQQGQDQAIINRQIIGFTITPEQYYFSVREKEGWSPISDGSLRNRPIDPKLTVEIGEGDLLSFPPLRKHQPSPQIIFLPNGESTPFILRISNHQHTNHASITGSPTGEITLSQ